jgi:hypothetical protein
VLIAATGARGHAALLHAGIVGAIGALPSHTELASSA